MTTDASPASQVTGGPADTYSLYRDDALLPAANGDPAPSIAARVHGAFRALILDPEFPCVAARSALNQNSYRFSMYQEMNSDDATDALARDLAAFVEEQLTIEGQFTTFIACFDAPKVKDGIEFERMLWEQLARLNAIDTAPWDDAVSSDSSDPQFSFSFAGRGFFVVGLAPSGERWARTFPWPVMAFNAHFQFEKLRENGQFERMQEVIRGRDIELQGDLNPNLSNFGEHTEAKQYSGREVGPDWQCPVRFDDHA